MLDTINIIFAKDEVDPKREKELIETMRANFDKFGFFKVGQFELARTRDEVTKLVATNRYQAVICMEYLNKDAVAGGYIRQWKELKQDLSIILILQDDKYAQDKMFFLYYKTHYYTALFRKDFTDGEEAAKLIRNGRTAQEAVKYYGLEENELFKKEYMENKNAPSEDIPSESETPSPTPLTNLVTDIGEIFPGPVEENEGLGHHSYTDDSNEFDEEQMESEPEEENIPNREPSSFSDNTNNNNFFGGYQMENNGYNPTYTAPYEPQRQPYNQGEIPSPYPQQSFNTVPEPRMSSQPMVKNTFSVEPYSGAVVAAVSPSAIIIEVPGADFLNSDIIRRGTEVSLILPTRK